MYSWTKSQSWNSSFGLSPAVIYTEAGCEARTPIAEPLARSKTLAVRVDRIDYR